MAKWSASQHVGALTVELEGAKERATELNEELRRTQTRLTELSEASPIVPDAVLRGTDDPNLKDLAQRISHLEQEKDALLSQFATSARDLFDPSSELGTLISELSSPDGDARCAAVQGLFALGDKRAFSSLVAYFNRFPKEATSAYRPSIGEWLSFLWDLDEAGAIQFAIQLLETGDVLQARVAYRFLLEGPVQQKEYLKAAIAPLQSVALRSPNALARAQAKLLLTSFEQRLEKVDEPKPDKHERSLMQVLLDVEKAVTRLVESQGAGSEPVEPDTATKPPPDGGSAEER